MKAAFLVAAALCGAVASADVVFSSANGFGGARAGSRCRLVPDAKLLKIVDIGYDMSINFGEQAIDPFEVTGVEYRYRARGTGARGGQLYYWNAGSKAADTRKWLLPAPVADGQWHTCTLTRQALVNAASWEGGGLVTGLRLDPTDAEGGEIDIAYLALKTGSGPSAAPRDVAGLDAPIWPALEPRYYDAAHDPACTMKGKFYRGDFISAADDQCGHNGLQKFSLRRVFMLKDKPVDAWLQGMGDQEAVFRVNGKEVGCVHYSHNTTVNVGLRENVLGLVKAGENVLSADYEIFSDVASATNFPFTGGVMAELFVKYADGSFERIDTDSAWQSSTDGQVWKGVVRAPKPPLPPRATRFAYCDFADPQRCLGGGPDTEHVLAGEKVMLRYAFRGQAPDVPFTVKLWLKKGGSTWWDEEINVQAENVQCLADGTWRLDLAFEAPLYLSSGTYTLQLQSNSIYCLGGVMGGALTVEGASAILDFATPPKVTMKPIAGRPEIHIDGKPFALLWGGVQQNKRPDQRPRHSDMPLTAVTVYNQYAEWHPRLGVYDFAAFDRQAEKYRRANPTAHYIWDLTVYPPPDFAKAFPQEMACDGKGDRASVGRFSWSWASARALAEIQEMVSKAIDYLEHAPYANRIIGYRVNSGVTIEWLGWDAKPGQVKDFSEPNVRAFRAFCAEHYPELKDPHVPGLAERAALDAPDDILWDRAKHLNAIAYMEYNSEIIAKDLLVACGTAKATLARLGRQKLVGTYYGYTFFLNANGCDQRRGHFALDYLLAHNDGRVDFLMSPQSYGQRRLGDTCGDMKPFATLAMAGIKPIIEDDTRTYNRHGPIWMKYNQTLNAEQTANILKRNGAIALCHGTSPYFYALCTGIDFDSPECAEVGRGLRTALEVANRDGIARHAEVALVASEKSIVAMPNLMKRQRTATGRKVQAYLPDGTSVCQDERFALFNGEVFMAAHTLFSRAGAPVDFLLAEDLKRRPGDYRLYVFLNLFTCDEETRAAVAKLRAAGKTILWLYAPGYANDGTVAAMEKLTGMAFARTAGATVAGVTVKADGRYMGVPEAKVAQAFYPVKPDVVLGTYADGTPGLAQTRLGQSLNYFSGTWQLDLPFIRAVEKAAGVFAYTESDDPIEANDAFVTLHARSPGVKTIHLPHKAKVVTEVFSGRVVARDADSFRFSATLHGSYLFHFVR
ncbi:MAG: hypothetical protein MJ240_07710 [Kiritimatiellae bacterium]|nr:hypothetical protein [Kiritimatiellia bacterium]